MHEAPLVDKERNRGFRALAVTVGALACLACSSGNKPPSETRPPEGQLHYVMLLGWHPADPSLKLSQATGAVFVDGDPGVKDKPQSQWNNVVLLGVSDSALRAALEQPDGSLGVAFSDPSENVHVATVPANLISHLRSDRQHPGLDEMALLLGADQVEFEFGVKTPTGFIVLPTQQVGGVVSLAELAREHPGTATVASPPQ